MATNRDFVVKNGLVVTDDIQLGHASDTTIARASAGQITVAGTAVVLAGSASHDGFSDFVANEHIDHSGVSILGGNGLTGGGNITSSRTLAVGAGTGITVNSNDVAVTAAQTGITSVVNASLEIGRDADNRIKFGTDNQIIFEVSGGDNVIFKASGEIEASSLDISGDVDVDGTLEADAITLNGTSLATSATTDTTNASNISSGTLATGRLAAALTAQTSMLNTSLVVGRDADNQIKFSTDNQMIFRVGAGDGVTFKASGEIEATSLDISGDVDVDGTLEADAITVNGSALASSATTDTTNASNISSGTLASGRLPDLAVSDFAASAIVTESEGIGSNDNDTTLPTSAAVKDYVDNNAGGGGVSLSGSTNNTITTVTGSNAIQGEANLTFDGTTLAVTASGTSTTLLLESTDAGATDAPILELYRNSSSPANTDDLGQILWSGEKSDGSKYSITKMYGQINTVDNSDRLMINIASSGGSGLNDYEYMRFDGGVRDIIINEGGQDIDFRIEGDSDSVLFFTDASSDRIGIGTNSPDAKLHVSSGTDLDCGIIIEADTDNNDEDDLPFLWFKQDGDITVHAIQATSNRLQIINNISASGGIDFALGTTNNTGTTNPSTGTTTALSIESDGGVQARKTVIKTVSTNTTLADEDSGKTIYWTGGTLTLPSTAQQGQQFVIINNKGSSATPALGTSNAIQTGWTAHAAMDDETARTYISVAANKWIYIG